ncbi:helix-turn-helix domain-containing protein [Halorubrum halophilum]|uniref:winged helix-turn-helix transcriptional regulator n=1 Tax=Halorubrum halophilum TaxID=413816 RepID=UPI00186B4F45|nr:helix-turn-helix domain-containing protein [Halorubrum halophilum]
MSQDHPKYDQPSRVARDEALTDLFQALGRPHTVAIARRFACDPGPWRYSELESTLDISPTTLSRRLSTLESLGIVSRRAYDESPPRVEYETTERGEALRPVFEQLGEWVAESP